MGELRQRAPSVLIVGGGVMGLGSALHLAEAGCTVTVLEKEESVAKVASNINGAMLCPSLCASWASFKFLSENRNELRRISLSPSALTDPAFYRWCAWFALNGLWPGRDERNHAAQRNLGAYSIDCLGRLKARYGAALAFNQTADNTIKLFHDRGDKDHFLNEATFVDFWRGRGVAFNFLTREQIQGELPQMDLENDSTLVGAVWNEPAIDSSGDINTFCGNLERLMEEKFGDRVTIKKGVEVRQLLLNGERTRIAGVRCAGSDAVLEADKYILATGVNTNGMAKSVGVTAPIYPMRGNVVTVPTNPSQPFLRRNIYSSPHGAVVVPLAATDDSPEVLRISGDVQAVGYDHGTDVEGCRKVLERARSLFKPGYLKENEATFKSALRPLSADDLPLIGKTLFPNLYIISGHGSKGWTLSFGSMRMMADIALGKETEIDNSAFCPTRFHPIRGKLHGF